MRTKSELLEYQRQYRRKNPRKIAAYKKAHPQQYTPELYEKMKAYRKNNEAYKKYQREYQRTYISKWRKKHFKLHPRKAAAHRRHRNEYNKLHRLEINAQRMERYYRTRK